MQLNGDSHTALWSHWSKKNVFSDCLKTETAIWQGRLSEVRRHPRGPAALKALSLKLVRVRLTRSVYECQPSAVFLCGRRWRDRSPVPGGWEQAALGGPGSRLSTRHVGYQARMLCCGAEGNGRPTNGLCPLRNGGLLKVLTKSISVMQSSKQSRCADCWLTPNRNVFSLCWKRTKFLSCRRCGGKLFHTRRPAALKLRSPTRPNLFFVNSLFVHYLQTYIMQ